MLEALSINIFSAANDASPAPPLEAPLQSTDLFANGWATTATDPAAAAAAATATTTAAMEPEDNNYTYVLHMAASHNIVACAGSNNLIRIYDVSQPRRQAPLLATLNPAKPAGNSPVTGVVFVENALISCSESGRLFLWDLRAPATPAAKFSCPPAGGGDTSCVCVRGDGKVVAAGVGSSLRLWDVGTRKVMTTYEEAHTDDVTMVKFHPTVSNRLISGSLDGLICVTDTSISPTPDTDEDEGDTLVSGTLQVILFCNVLVYYFSFLVLSVEHPINYFDFTDQQAKTIGVITCDEEFSVWSLESVNKINTYRRLLLIYYFFFFLNLSKKKYFINHCLPLTFLLFISFCFIF